MIDKKTLQNLLAEIGPVDYELKKAHGGFIWKKKDATVSKMISIAINTLSDGFRLQQPIESIVFEKHEKTICRVSKEMRLSKTEVLHKIHQLDGYNDYNVNYDLLDKAIHTIEESGLVLQEIKKFIQIVALPFIDEYSNIQNIAALLHKTPLFDIPQYIHGDFPHHYAFLIMREAGILGYEQKKAEALNFLRGIVSKKPDNQDNLQYLRFFEHLFLIE